MNELKFETLDISYTRAKMLVVHVKGKGERYKAYLVCRRNENNTSTLFFTDLRRLLNRVCGTTMQWEVQKQIMAFMEGIDESNNGATNNGGNNE